MTEREKEIIATKRNIKILYYKIKLKIAQSENNTKLEIEKIRAEIAKSESRIIKFILASSIIQTIFIISAVLTIKIYALKF
jgi:hypothetical protein